MDGDRFPCTWPLPLHHSWPLTDQSCHLPGDPAAVALEGALAAAGTGLWQCTLATGALRWSTSVFDLFGVPRDEAPRRVAAIALYESDSREAMERLRAHAIRHRRGFTMDAAIRPASSAPRWMRLVAAPVLEGDSVIGLRGTKTDVTDEYRRSSRRGLRVEPTLLWTAEQR